MEWVEFSKNGGTFDTKECGSQTGRLIQWKANSKNQLQEGTQMHSAKVAAQIRVQIRRFSGKSRWDCPRRAARLVREVIYGVQSRGSVRLSKIARALEEKIRLKKVMARLSRQLNRPGLRQRVRENLLKLAAPRVGTETLLVVDLTDVIKPYARKMEYLARVRDGSTKKLGNGYWCCQVVGLERGSAEVMPPGSGAVLAGGTGIRE